MIVMREVVQIGQPFYFWAGDNAGFRVHVQTPSGGTVLSATKAKGTGAVAVASCLLGDQCMCYENYFY